MKYFISILTILVASIMSSCTHNDGDIGYWFGTWHVETIEKDGTAIDGYHGTHFFLFQSSVFQLRYTDELHAEMQTTGRWEDNGDKITISFPDKEQIWVTLYGLTVEENAENHFKIEFHSGKNIILSLNGKDGHTYKYHLKKWG